MSNITDFISQYGNVAASTAASAGLSTSEVLGQWGLETGWGQHFAGTNNPGNVSPGGHVANYATIGDGAKAYLGALNYEGIGNMANDPAGFAAALQSQGYATDPNYADKITAAIKTVEANNLGSLGYGMGGAGIKSDPNAAYYMGGSSNGKPVDKSGPLEWISSHIADYGLVFFGGVLIVGALLISQRQTVVNIAKTVATV